MEHIQDLLLRDRSIRFVAIKACINLLHILKNIMFLGFPDMVNLSQYETHNRI